MWADPGRHVGMRTLLAPASWLYRTGEGLAAAAWAAGWRRSERAALPTVSVGNLTVGGTGKTPVASWIAGWMLERAVRPAIVLRGYGDDEPAVHRRLQPEAVVIVSPVRARGVAQAAAAGAQVAILDDGFQHRALARDVDLVLLSVEQVARELDAHGRWHARLLPAGPYREPVDRLARAHAVLLTVKTADARACAQVAAAVHAVAPSVQRVVMELRAGALQPVAGRAEAVRPFASGPRVLAIAGIGAPELFGRQLAALGAEVTLRAFADHHDFTEAEIRTLVAEAESHAMAVCTLKDAVKLAARWPASARSLSYLTQRCVPGEGSARLEALLTTLVPHSLR
ncbi:MAG: tetraacyldisaccharide 4'-kinase [Gemmatimonadaceae bacterium]|nr:tetraacyldisaccharide 4'-kinase [Gemmatimonadaceae bacterium]